MMPSHSLLNKDEPSGKGPSITNGTNASDTFLSGTHLDKYKLVFIYGDTQHLKTGGRLTEIQLIEIVFYHLIEIMLIT
jgi:hypothetical protein